MGYAENALDAALDPIERFGRVLNSFSKTSGARSAGAPLMQAISGSDSDLFGLR